ncbi:hypothetical protein AAE478_010437 [Parahypoxylon ruwenzoriense]
MDSPNSSSESESSDYILSPFSDSGSIEWVPRPYVTLSETEIIPTPIPPQPSPSEFTLPYNLHLLCASPSSSPPLPFHPPFPADNPQALALQGMPFSVSTSATTNNNSSSSNSNEVEHSDADDDDYEAQERENKREDYNNDDDGTCTLDQFWYEHGRDWAKVRPSGEERGGRGRQNGLASCHTAPECHTCGEPLDIDEILSPTPCRVCCCFN